jgi:hypothetical protein
MDKSADTSQSGSLSKSEYRVMGQEALVFAGKGFIASRFFIF